MISVKGYMVPSLAIGVRLLDSVWEYTLDLVHWSPCDKWPHEEAESHAQQLDQLVREAEELLYAADDVTQYGSEASSYFSQSDYAAWQKRVDALRHERR